GSAVLKIMIVIACIKIIDLGIVSPRLVGEKLGLHPVLMIFSIFVFGKLLGLLGLFIAIPVTAILKVLIMEWYDQNFLHREFIRDDSSSTSKE
ncbi:MAG TPA: AI-2E family transporter, partial [bacterium]|nr:AI-2E family transporter [bacterium]